MKGIAINLFLSLGGVALIWKVVGDNARQAAHKGAGWLFVKFPIAKDFLIHNEDKIVEILKEAKEGVDEAEKDNG